MNTYNFFSKEVNGHLHYLCKGTQWALTISLQRNSIDTDNIFAKELNGQLQYLCKGTQ